MSQTDKLAADVAQLVRANPGIDEFDLARILGEPLFQIVLVCRGLEAEGVIRSRCCLAFEARPATATGGDLSVPRRSTASG